MPTVELSEYTLNQLEELKEEEGHLNIDSVVRSLYERHASASPDTASDPAPQNTTTAREETNTEQSNTGTPNRTGNEPATDSPFSGYKRELDEASVVAKLVILSIDARHNKFLYLAEDDYEDLGRMVNWDGTGEEHTWDEDVEQTIRDVVHKLSIAELDDDLNLPHDGVKLTVDPANLRPVFERSEAFPEYSYEDRLESKDPPSERDFDDGPDAPF